MRNILKDKLSSYIFIVLLVVSCFSGCSNTSKDIPSHATDSWPAEGIAIALPVPPSKYYYDQSTNENLFIYAYGLTTQQYYDYIEECKNIGFTLTLTQQGSFFAAQNAEGLRVSITKMNNYVEILLRRLTP